MKVRKIAASTLGVGALVAVGLLGATPAQAAPVVDESGVVTNPVAADGSITQTAAVEDEGGVLHTFTVKWAKKYKDPAGAIRVSVPSLVDVRTDEDTTEAGESADAGEDIHFDVSSHGTVFWTQHKNLDGVDLDDATDNQVTLNPRNPISDAGDTYIRVRAGVDGDGKKSSRFVYFVQPEGVGVVPVVTSTLRF
jgi:hypothetical protein